MPAAVATRAARLADARDRRRARAVVAAAQAPANADAWRNTSAEPQQAGSPRAPFSMALCASDRDRPTPVRRAGRLGGTFRRAQAEGSAMRLWGRIEPGHGGGPGALVAGGARGRRRGVRPQGAPARVVGARLGLCPRSVPERDRRAAPGAISGAASRAGTAGGARSAHQALTRRGCLSGVRTANGVSSTTPLRGRATQRSRPRQGVTAPA